MPDCFGDIVDQIQCHSCNEWLPLNNHFFYRDKNIWHGYHPRCKDCSRIYKRERASQDNKKYWFQKRSADAKHRAKKSGFIYELKFEDLDFPDFCPVSGLQLSYTLKSADRKLRSNAASLDRIDNTLGYIPGNVRITSWIANKWKGNLDHDSFLHVVQQIYETSILNNQLECKCRTVA